ncbi:origin recognition complex subunit 2 [Macrosteles quadrilineatus]|uniref:origin recognition complex subunit 2 n=1 Tax=Macrosteles quadrilineatus TaxID=74068 RepID=UPI0023E2A558|nr:origin recognition complex subunit 2 [Macrosteles quadrilineatus]XP_054282562.1 origin recognition complex subunit 2 [Macrosteles quadrilineatus]XP_054282563.1 origin recognition complex subunit 2 [Macrosteles quadrilineatus]
MSTRRSSRISLSLKSRNSPEKDSCQLNVKFISDDNVKQIIHIEDIRSGAAQPLESGLNTPKSNRKPIKRRLTAININTIEEESNSEDFVIGTDEKCEKPRDICYEDDIEGGEMCSFRTPRKRKAMLQKAKESVSKDSSGTPTAKKTPIKVATPKRGRPRNSSKVIQTPSKQTPKKQNATPSRNVVQSCISIPKTPYNTRAKTIKAIKVHTRQMECDDSDAGEDEDSDFEGSGSESSESEEAVDESDSDSGKGSEGPSQSCRRSLRFQPSATPTAKRRGKDINYIFTADEYFESKSTKSKTSDHVLSKLRTPRLDASEMLRLLKDSSMTPAHCSVLARRREDDMAMYERWMIALSQGFSILAYGLGSKYKILQKFHCKMLPDSHVLVVNGFFPSLSIKEIVDTIATDLLGLKHSLPSPHAVIEWIESRHWTPRVFLVIHNIDAEPLRCDKTQQLLAHLASLPRVHLIASIDHINCPLLWDQAKLSAFNFVWEDTTSFLPYQEETSYETSLMVHNSGSLALSSLLNVYRSLTHNSRGVFRIILQKHLDENNAKYNGMAFSELYGRCREEMLVTSDLALRTMLTEFLDHQMVKWRKDGEHLYIPTDIGVLRQFNNLTQND